MFGMPVAFRSGVRASNMNPQFKQVMYKNVHTERDLVSACLPSFRHVGNARRYSQSVKQEP